MIASLFHRRVRGFRIIDLIALFCLSVLVLGVYFAKAAAGREGAEISAVKSAYCRIVVMASPGRSMGTIDKESPITGSKKRMTSGGLTSGISRRGPKA